MLMPRVTWRDLTARWSSTFVWIAIGWIVVFWRLGYASLLDPDEAHYAELTREMMHSGSWLVPLLDGKPFIDKPVLFHWLQGASVLLLGETEFAARLPTAASAVGLFAITRWVGTALFDDEIGSLGAIMFATIPATFALASIAIFDMVFALFLFGALGVSGRREAIQYANGTVWIRAADARRHDQRAGGARAHRAVPRGRLSGFERNPALPATASLEDRSTGRRDRRLSLVSVDAVAVWR